MNKSTAESWKNSYEFKSPVNICFLMHLVLFKWCRSASTYVFHFNYLIQYSNRNKTTSETHNQS